MKIKVLLLLSIIVMCSGCNSVNNMSIEKIIDFTSSSNLKLSNQYRSGYKYYVPSSVGVYSKNDYNEVLLKSNYRLYFYVDVISYYNKVVKNYEVNNDAYYSKEINNGDKFGYIEINKYDDNYFLLEIMYNYAKIEVIIDEDRINEVVTYAMIILTSISYNDDIINNLMEDNVLDYKEINFDIFKTNESANDFLEIEQDIN